jgi:rubrerythrin
MKRQFDVADQLKLREWQRQQSTTFTRYANALDSYMCAICSAGFDFSVLFDPLGENQTAAGRALQMPRFCPMCGAERRA